MSKKDKISKGKPSLSKVFQIISALLVAAWVCCYFIGQYTMESTSASSALYKYSLVVTVVFSFIAIFLATRWWQRLAWIVVFACLLALALFWFEYDSQSFQF